MKVVRHSFLAPLVLILAGCASGGGEQPRAEANDRELAYSRLAGVQSGMVTTQLELESLRALFDRFDDAYGAWLASFELCQFYHESSSEEWLEACLDSLARAELTGEQSPRFLTEIQLYLYSGEQQYLLDAERHVASGEDRKLLSMARGEFASLSLPRDEHPDAGVRARQYYWYGKLHGKDDALTAAHQLFMETGNSRGLADVLYLRAQRAAEGGDQERARILAGRSANVLESMGDVEKAEKVRRWATGELAAQ